MEAKSLQTRLEQLSADNELLAQIVHKDNKLITAMTSSVLNLMEHAPQYDIQQLTAYSQALRREILSLSAHRQETLSKISGTITGQFHTGYAMLDSISHICF